MPVVDERSQFAVCSAFAFCCQQKEEKRDRSKLRKDSRAGYLTFRRRTLERCARLGKRFATVWSGWRSNPPPNSFMSFQTRRRIVRRKRRSSASSVKSLSERLCEWRERNDLSQSEAAIKLRLSKRTLQEWQQGRAKPRHLAMDAVAAVIGR